jgi:hypothetical protein
MAFITQNRIDGRYQAKVDDVLIAGYDYDAVEKTVSELIAWRSQKQTAEDSLDALEQQRQTTSAWGSAENAVMCLGMMVGIIVVATGFHVWPLIKEMALEWFSFGG